MLTTKFGNRYLFSVYAQATIVLFFLVARCFTYVSTEGVNRNLETNLEVSDTNNFLYIGTSVVL